VTVGAMMRVARVHEAKNGLRRQSHDPDKEQCFIKHESFPSHLLRRRWRVFFRLPLHQTRQKPRGGILM
jgi:hypothetical protein